MKTKFNQMRECFTITRNFSLKVNGHLKMLCFLVNNLIESDDSLKLVEEKLVLPRQHSCFNANFQQGSKNDANQSTYSNETNLMNNFVKQVQREFQSVSKLTQQGENHSIFLQNLMEKLIDKLLQYKDQEVNLQKKMKRSQSVFLNTNPVRSTSKNCQKERKSIFQNSIDQTDIFYTNQHRRISSIEPFNLQENYDLQEVNALKQTIEDLKSQIKNLNDKIQQKNQKVQKNDGIETVLQQMIEIKKNDEETIKKKNKKINFLKNELQHQKSMSRYSSVKNLTKLNGHQNEDPNKKLKEENQKLQKIIKKFQRQNEEMEIYIENLQHENQNLQITNDQMQKIAIENAELQEKNLALCQLLDQGIDQQVKQTITITSNTQNQHQNDLLKCLFMQTQFIENEQIDSISDFSSQFISCIQNYNNKIKVLEDSLNH